VYKYVQMCLKSEGLCAIQTKPLAGKSQSPPASLKITKIYGPWIRGSVTAITYYAHHKHGHLQLISSSMLCAAVLFMCTGSSLH
jgi:hypothetical protein